MNWKQVLYQLEGDIRSTVMLSIISLSIRTINRREKHKVKDTMPIEKVTYDLNKKDY